VFFRFLWYSSYAWQLLLSLVERNIFVSQQIRYFWIRLTCKYYTLFIQILASLTVSLCSMVVGFASAYTSPALPSMNRPGSPLSVTEEEVSTHFHRLLKCVTEVIMIHRILITGFMDRQSHATGSTHWWHGRRAPYRVHR